mmetsp:Transcript_18532/g.41994  ORF Transcript_18532/g.41994 Transcript_18532/m.41994 type:complete len:268 (+) Transcript_18532:61-864(+)|eukprot:CAMPEP_0197901450 /NCGR_PEP_ID=MMETSP1439-20131203/51048_1 /TAXON_ID=66791 /ORGANISM="Gonyaulax spinifera, Strain CCMP409" /LENGTH=267 /DNA_ID=CAMNT_0043522417 /DNA_START=48 /DNA_END=851 /DNA_ORIENTATION=-
MPDSVRRSLADVVSGFDGLSEVSSDILAALTATADRTEELRALQPGSLARTALAAASASPASTKVIAAICEQVASYDDAMFAAFEPSDIAMLLWALAAAGHRDVPAMTAIGWQLAERAWEFSAEDLAKAVFAFAELRLCHQAMMATVSMEVMWKIDQFSARSLAQVAESCARLGYCKEPMFDWLAARVIGRLEDYEPDDLAAVVCSFAEASIKHEVLLTTVAGEVARRWPDLHDEELSRFVWAFDKLGVVHRAAAQPLYHPRLSSSA